MKAILMFLMMFVATVNAAEQPKSVQKDARVYEVNRYGQTQYSKKSYRVKGDRVYEVNRYGQTQYQKPTLKIKSK